MTRHRSLIGFLLVIATSCATPTPTPTPSSRGAPPGLSEIRESDLRRDIFALGGDAMRGREAGTLDEMRASVWVAERAREAGLLPAGDDGTYFQWWPLRRTVLAENSRVAVGDSLLIVRRDVMPTATLTAGAAGGGGAGGGAATASVTLDLPLLFVDNPGTGGNTQDLAGKAAATVVRTAALATQAQTALRARGAGAILIIGQDSADTEEAWSALAQRGAARGSYTIDTGQVAPAARSAAADAVPVLRARFATLSKVRGAAARGQRLVLNIYTQTFDYPSANVIAKVPGTDPARRDEYVLFSAHQDHDGVRNILRGDSIWNGADDNASVSVALLAIGRAVSRHPMPRTALFVWHGAEERGLLGSRWFVHKPIVPLKSIVAVLNGDMIGRNAPDSAALSGWRPPYRNSKALAQAALDANSAVSKFTLDTLWDLPNHCEGWYFRSDHLPYAQAGVPALFFSTLLHGDYHTPEDEPSRIDIHKLWRMTNWMYATGWTIGNARERPDVDPGFRATRPDRSNCIRWNRPPGSLDGRGRGGRGG